MRHVTAKAAKILFLTTVTAAALALSAAAAEESVGVGAITGSSVRLRAEASTSSSILTTLNKGNVVALLNANAEDNWYHVAFAGQEGYVYADYLIKDRDNVFTTYGRANCSGVRVRAEASTESEVVGTLTEGTSFTITGFENGWYRVKCRYGTIGCIRSDLVDLIPSLDYSSGSAAGSAIVALAQQYLGVRYVYGGASPKGFDCSGFTMYVYGQFGVSLPHTATGQWQSGKGTRVYSISALQPGDLVFFNDPSRNAGKACSHAGIYVGDGQFIHASSSGGRVVYSTLLTGYYNRYFVGGIHI